MALHFALRQLGKTTFLINPGPTPEKYSLVDPRNEIEVFSPSKSLPKVDGVLIFDTNELSMMGPLSAALQSLSVPLSFIDHHVPSAELTPLSYADPKKAATSELVYELMENLGAPLSLESAVGLYVAVTTDTGGFRYARTSAYTHRMAAALIEQGVAPEEVQRSIYARETPAKLKLLGHTLEGTQLSEGGEIAWITISLADRLRYGATVEDTESFLGLLGNLQGVRMALLFREEEGGKVKLSARGYDGVEVLGLASLYGGGGHRFSAGARVEGTLNAVASQVLSSAKQLLG
jgi:bifunctional oligoribonuclease and PAP phosphatase NrnA